MTALRQQNIDLVQRSIPEESMQQVHDILITFIKVEGGEGKRPRRTPGALANDDFSSAPDFDSCFEDNPAAYGMEDYV